MSEKTAKRLRDIEERLGVIERFMVRVLQVMNDKRKPMKYAEPPEDVDSFEEP